MADQTTQSIQIAAPADQVMAVISDLSSYPQWADGIKEAEVLETDQRGRPTQARFALEKAVVKDEYVLAYDWADDGRSVRWRLLKGQMQKAQDGSYTLTEQDGRTTV